MDRVFSVDDIADDFWPPLASPTRPHEDDDVERPSSTAVAASSSKLMRMNRSSSEWEFQMFLQDAVSPDHNSITQQRDDAVEIEGNHHHNNDNQQREIAAAAAAARVPSPNIPMDSEKYQAFLKSRLELECAAAAVALTRATNGKAHKFAAAASDIGSQSLNSSQRKANCRDSSKVQNKDSAVPVGIPLLPTVSRRSGAPVKSTTSGSSGEQSDDDEAEEETDTTQSTDPADAKRMRRMISNRESARRSRRRKQAHLTELETQVSQVRVENSSLVKRFTDISQKYNEAAVDNRVLKADVETLRAKVKMAEESVKRVTGLNSLFQAMSEISTMATPSFASSPSDTPADPAVPVQDDPKQHYYPAPSNNYLPNHRIPNSLVEIPPVENAQAKATAVVGTNKTGGTASIQRVASLELLQKHIREGPGSSGTQRAGDQ